MSSFVLADDDVELDVLGCRVDILGTNCDRCMCLVQCCFTSTGSLGRGALDDHLDFHTAPELVFVSKSVHALNTTSPLGSDHALL